MAQPLVVLQPFHEPTCLVDEALLGRSRPKRADERLDHAVAEEARDPPPGAGLLLGRVGVVAAEDLVPAITRERDGDLAAGEPGDEIGGEDGEVADRVVEERHQVLEESDHVRTDHLDRMGDTEPLGHPLRPGELVVAGIVEADAEGVGRPHRRHHQRAVHSAREEGAQGHVADQLALH